MNKLLSYCETGNMKMFALRYESLYEGNKDMMHPRKFILYALEYNSINIVKYLISYEGNKENIDMLKNNDKFLKNLYETICMVVIQGKLKTLKYILNESPFAKSIKIDYEQTMKLVRYASTNGRLENLNYILKHTSIEGLVDDALTLACEYDHIEVVKYLLTSPLLKCKANIHANNEASIKMLLKVYGFVKNEKKDAIVEYLIFDYKIEKTFEIEKLLMRKALNPIQRMFDRRDLEKKLNMDLQASYNNFKRNKI